MCNYRPLKIDSFSRWCLKILLTFTSQDETVTERTMTVSHLKSLLVN